jgi:hypothetical protein
MRPFRVSLTLTVRVSFRPGSRWTKPSTASRVTILEAFAAHTRSKAASSLASSLAQQSLYATFVENCMTIPARVLAKSSEARLRQGTLRKKKGHPCEWPEV